MVRRCFVVIIALVMIGYSTANNDVRLDEYAEMKSRDDNLEDTILPMAQRKQNITGPEDDYGKLGRGGDQMNGWRETMEKTIFTIYLTHKVTGHTVDVEQRVKYIECDQFLNNKLNKQCTTQYATVQLYMNGDVKPYENDVAVDCDCN